MCIRDRVNPVPYIVSNQLGFFNILELSETYNVEKLLYASSSSVYGDRDDGPFREDYKLEIPKSLYALSKVSNEIMAREFPSNGTQRIGLRFFTVYGPWGRPDMAVFRALAAARLEKPFQLTANLSVLRDFTFIDDLTKCIASVMEGNISTANPILNLSGQNPYSLKNIFDFLDSKQIPFTLIKNPPDELDVKITHGSNSLLRQLGMYIPKTNLTDGLEETWNWLMTQDLSAVRSWYEQSIV